MHVDYASNIIMVASAVKRKIEKNIHALFSTARTKRILIIASSARKLPATSCAAYLNPTARYVLILKSRD